MCLVLLVGMDLSRAPCSVHRTNTFVERQRKPEKIASEKKQNMSSFPAGFRYFLFYYFCSCFLFLLCFVSLFSRRRFLESTHFDFHLSYHLPLSMFSFLSISGFILFCCCNIFFSLLLLRSALHTIFIIVLLSLLAASTVSHIHTCTGQPELCLISRSFVALYFEPANSS